MSDATHTLSSYVSFYKRRYALRIKLFRGGMAVAPMVDIAMLMILFVFANSWLVLRPGVSIEAPFAAFTDGADARAAVLSITRERLMFFNDTRVTWETLDTRLRESAQIIPDRSLLIEADERVAHGDILRVRAMAISNGFSRVLLATSGATRP